LRLTGGVKSLRFFLLVAMVAWTPNRAVSADATNEFAGLLTALPPVPELRIPPEPAAWRREQAEIRATLTRLLGDFPARPTVPKVRVLAREEHGTYSLERFEFDNGLGDRVPGVLLMPMARKGRLPAILYHHWHGGEYDRGNVELFQTNHTPVAPGPALAERGFAVLAIDVACFGERQGQGADGLRGGAGEMSAAKFDLWAGRTLWGRIVRDDQLALDYLASRPEVDPDRIGAMGMSMGATRTWWLMALDERIKAGVAVACLTRYQDLIAAGGLKYHGIYYYVPGMLRHFDTEAVVAACAPRPLLCLNGDEDAGSPVAGIHRIEAAAAPGWSVLGARERFRSEVFAGLGHVYTPAMWKQTTGWFDRWLAENR
jgi:dienelactone hydrolase